LTIVLRRHILPGMKRHARRIVLVVVLALSAAFLTARAAISIGEMADITSCLSEEIRSVREHSHLRLGAGVMTIQTVIGEGLVNAYKLSREHPKGPQLLVDKQMAERLVEFSMTQLCGSEKAIFVDWIRPELPIVKEILRRIGRPATNSDKLLANLKDYISQRDKWPRGQSEVESWRKWKEDTERTLVQTVT
jgi:hypothetical protein